MATARKYSLKQMLTGEQEQPQNILPQLVAMGGSGGFGGTTLPGAPVNPAEQGGGAIDMSGWAALLKKMMGQPDENTRLAPGNWEDMNY